MDSKLKLFKDLSARVTVDVCHACEGVGVDEEGDKCIDCDGSGTQTFYE